MHKKALAIAWALALGSVADMAAAADQPAAPSAHEEQDTLSVVRASLRMDKREFVKAAMGLDEQESAKFWSIYHPYEADLMTLFDRRLKLIEDYADNFESMTEDKAAKLAKTAFELHRARTNLLETYYKKVAKALSNKVAVRFAQVENTLNAALDVKLGAAVPLMPKQ